MNPQKLKLAEALLSNPAIKDMIPTCSPEIAAKFLGEEPPKNTSQEMILQTKFIAHWVALVVNFTEGYS